MTKPPSLATLLRRAEKASAKAEAAADASRNARYDLNAKARLVAWAALEKRGIKRGDRIGFTEPKRARWRDRAPQLDALEAYRCRDHDENPCWQLRLRLTAINARGQRLKSPRSEFFDLAHPRDIARLIVKVAE